MSWEVVFLRGAESDLQSAFNRYEDKVEGLDREFLLTIDGSLTAVGQFPEISRVYLKTIRRLVVSRFPYGIFYAVEGNASSFMQSWTCGRTPKKSETPRDEAPLPAGLYAKRTHQTSDYWGVLTTGIYGSNWWVVS